MKHKAIIFTLSCLILGLCSCKSTPVPKEIDINNRPKGYFLDYWIKEKIDIGNTNKLKTRKVLINIMQKDNISIEHKLLISYQMLLDILDENIYKEEIEKYTDINKLNKLIELFKEVEFNIYESIEELNYLFLDIIKDYK